MKYLSICSGIEAATVAWHTLGWEPAAFAEIEAFPAAVLAHHYPHVPNLGDMTTIKGEEYRGVDVLVGGTPCQAFSVAGLRQGLIDPRGSLTLTFAKLADDMEVPFVVWENVPGVLSSKDNAFGCFLGLLAGEDDALIAPGGKWTDAGFVLGPKRAVAWRVLDAQFFGLAQRRRRVFVVACPRDGADPRAILFEREGVRRDSPPSREKGKGPAGTLESRSRAGGFPGTDGACGGHVVPANQITGPLCADGGTAKKHGPGGLTSIQHMLSGFIQPVCMAHGQGNAEIAGTVSRKWAKGSGGPAGDECYNMVATFQQSSLAGRGTLGFDPDANVSKPVKTQMDGQMICVTGPITHALKAEGHDGSEDGTGRGHPAVAIGWSEELTASKELAGTLQYGGQGGQHDGVMTPAMQVRRLTPMECERLQGFPDGYTAIPWRKKPAEDCPDGPRYKALGNSMAVPVMRWIGMRIKKTQAG